MGARELQSLLREVKNVRSPVQRMKLMTLAWRTVARLTPEERKELGSRLGVRGFESILEKLGPGPTGIAPAEVLRALDGAEDLDPSKLRGLVRGLRDPERRRELLRQGLDFLDRGLAEDDAVEADPEEPVEEEAGAAGESMERAVSPEAIRPPEPAFVSAPEPEPAEAARGDSVEVPPVAVPAPATTIGEQPEPVAAPVAEPRPSATPEPEPPRPPRAAPATAPLATAPPLPTPPPDETPADLVAAPSVGTSLMARFRALRRALDDDGEPDTAWILASVSSFPDGWARRRAVISFLKRGCPTSLDDALSVVEELERPADRRWACAALIDSRELSDDDVERILERFPFPSLSRRLRRRPGIAGHHR